MNANSHSERLWNLLHQSAALLTRGGFVDPVPPLPTGSASSEGSRGVGSDEIATRYGEHLAFGSTWPAGSGSSQPLALVFSQAPLTPEAVAFVRTWFENPRVNLVWADAFFLQPLPVFSGEKPPYAALALDLCQWLRPKAVLSLGAVPAQRLLGAPLSLDSLRSADYRFDRWSMVTTLDPEEFSSLADDEKVRFKGQVWKDLQRLLGKLKYG